MKPTHRLARPFEVASLALAGRECRVLRSPRAGGALHDLLYTEHGVVLPTSHIDAAGRCAANYGTQVEIYRDREPEPGESWPVQIWLPTDEEEQRRERDLEETLRAIECPSCGGNATTYKGHWRCEACGEEG